MTQQLHLGMNKFKSSLESAGKGGAVHVGTWASWVHIQTHGAVALGKLLTSRNSVLSLTLRLIIEDRIIYPISSV